MMFNFDPQVNFTEEFRAIAKETGAYIFIGYSVIKEGEPRRNRPVFPNYYRTSVSSCFYLSGID